jgi:rfaE bifunctional protein kinase chain/domain
MNLDILLKKVEDSISKLRNLKILVIGDIILDRWLKGSVERISPEAPVPILKVEREWNDLGGAANVAKILSFYSNNVSLFGVVGKDAFSFRVKNLMKKYSINDLTFVYGKTIVKTRLIAQNNQQMMRVDREEKLNLNSLPFQKTQIPKDFDAIFVIDYNKGVINSNLIDILKTNLSGKKIYLSYKPSNTYFDRALLSEVGFELLSLNKQEFKELLSKENLIYFDGDLLNSMDIIRNRYNINKMIVTLGKEGLCSLGGKFFNKVDGFEVEVFDVTGAGDNVISIFSLFDLVGFDMLECSILANIAGSICVSKPGTIAVKYKDIVNFLSKMIKTNQDLRYYTNGVLK